MVICPMGITIFCAFTFNQKIVSQQSGNRYKTVLDYEEDHRQ